MFSTMNFAEEKVYTTPYMDGIKYEQIPAASPKSVRTIVFQDVFPFACLSHIKESTKWEHPIALHFNNDSNEWGPNAPRHLHGHQIVAIETSSGRRLNIESKRLSIKVNRYLQSNPNHFVKVTYFNDVRWKVVPGDWTGLCRLALSCPAFETGERRDIASWVEKILSDCIANPPRELRETTFEILRWLSNRHVKDQMSWAELREATFMNFWRMKIPARCSPQLRDLHSIVDQVYDELFNKVATPQTTIIHPTPREDSCREEPAEQETEQSQSEALDDSLQFTVDEDYTCSDGYNHSPHHARVPTVPLSLTIDWEKDDDENRFSKSQNSSHPKNGDTNDILIVLEPAYNASESPDKFIIPSQGHERGISCLSFVSGFDGDDDWCDEEDDIDEEDECREEVDVRRNPGSCEWVDLGSVANDDACGKFDTTSAARAQLLSSHPRSPSRHN